MYIYVCLSTVHYKSTSLNKKIFMTNMNSNPLQLRCNHSVIKIIKIKNFMKETREGSYFFPSYQKIDFNMALALAY